MITRVHVVRSSSQYLWGHAQVWHSHSARKGDPITRALLIFLILERNYDSRRPPVHGTGAKYAISGCPGTLLCWKGAAVHNVSAQQCTMMVFLYKKFGLQLLFRTEMHRGHTLHTDCVRLLHRTHQLQIHCVFQTAAQRNRAYTTGVNEAQSTFSVHCEYPYWCTVHV